MNAKLFFRSFKSKIQDEVSTNNTLMEIYRNDAEFTPIVTKIIEEIINETEYGGAKCTSQREYYRIDVVGWVSKYESMKAELDKNKDLNLNPHFWNLKIAVEHENSKKDWTDEIIKLIHIKCPLKVVIAYNECGEDRLKRDQKKLEFVAKWMRKVDAFNIGTNEEYLVIFGNAYNGKEKKDYNSFDYIGYLYDYNLQTFIRLEE